MRTVLDKVLKHRTYEIELHSRHDGYQRGLAGTVYKICNKKIRSGSQCKWSANSRIRKISD